MALLGTLCLERLPQLCMLSWYPPPTRRYALNDLYRISRVNTILNNQFTTGKLMTVTSFIISTFKKILVLYP
jgi:hypothetical protein